MERGKLIHQLFSFAAFFTKFPKNNCDILQSFTKLKNLIFLNISLAYSMLLTDCPDLRPQKSAHTCREVFERLTLDSLGSSHGK